MSNGLTVEECRNTPERMVPYVKAGLESELRDMRSRSMLLRKLLAALPVKHRQTPAQMKVASARMRKQWQDGQLGTHTQPKRKKAKKKVAKKKRGRA